MTADALAQGLSALAAVVLPIAGGWAWKTQTEITALKTAAEVLADAEKEWKQDLKERLTRIESKVDNGRHK